MEETVYMGLIRVGGFLTFNSCLGGWGGPGSKCLGMVRGMADPDIKNCSSSPSCDFDI